SKEILSGAWEVPRAELITHRRIAPMNPEMITGVAATALDAANHRVTLDDGRTLDYDALVVATGITPRQLPHPDAPNIRVLRTLQDSLAAARPRPTGSTAAGSKSPTGWCVTSTATPATTSGARATSRRGSTPVTDSGCGSNTARTRRSRATPSPRTSSAPASPSPPCR